LDEKLRLAENQRLKKQEEIELKKKQREERAKKAREKVTYILEYKSTSCISQPPISNSKSGISMVI
jgi:hypothetical protein